MGMSDNTLIRVADHDGRQLLDKGVMTQTESVFIQQDTLAAAMETTAGRVLLRILKAVDYAGAQRRPVMLLGRKQAKGGFMISVTVPHPEKTSVAPPDVAGNGSPGSKNGTSSQRGTKFYAT